MFMLKCVDLLWNDLYKKEKDMKCFKIIFTFPFLD